VLGAQRLQHLSEFRNHHRLLAVRTGGDNSNLGAGFPLDEFQIAFGFSRQPIIVIDAVRGGLPTRKLFINRLDLFVSRDLRWNLLRLFAIDFVADANGNFRLLVEDIKLSGWCR
jgi:hypothetical protein